MSDETIVYVVITAVVVLFITNRVPVELVAVGSALALYFTDVLTLEQALAGFGDPTVLFIASLFIVSEAMESTGVTAWASQQLIAKAGDSWVRLTVLTMLLVALMSALITPNGAVAALVPVVVVLAVRLHRSPSELLLPLSFASFGGALLVLTGSPVNVIVSDASRAAGGGGFAFLEFAIVGIPLLIGTIGITVFLGPHLLPRRQPESMPMDFSEHARTLLTQYALDEPLFRMRVREGSPYVGKTREEVDASAYKGVTMISAQAKGAGGGVVSDALAVGDVVVVRGPSQSVQAMARDNALVPVRVGATDAEEDDLYSRDSGVAEAVIPPRSEAIGATVFPGMVTDSGDLVIIAVQRGGEDRRGKTVLKAGDTLLLQGDWQALDVNLEEASNVLAVDSPDRVRRQVVALGPRANIAIAVVLGMVVALATGAVPPAAAALTAAGALVLLRVVTMPQAYRSISWTVVVLIGAMIPLSTAMRLSGAADTIANHLVDVVGGYSPYVLIIALFILVAVMGQIISNTATALIVIPVAVSAALELDVNVQPVLMSVCIAASASFLTPIATTPNLMVLEPGGYRFGDYWKFGAPLMLLYFVVAIGLVPLVWSF